MCAVLSGGRTFKEHLNEARFAVAMEKQKNRKKLTMKMNLMMFYINKYEY